MTKKTGYRPRTYQEQTNNSTSNESNESGGDLADIFFTMDEKETMTNYYKDLPAGERNLVKNIISLDSKLKQNGFKNRMQ